MVFRIFVLLIMVFISDLNASTPKDAAVKLQSFLKKVPVGPGYAVVVVDPEEILLMYLAGVRNIQTGAPLQADTPIYIASQTKAYMGLLAAKLDADGILKLDRTLSSCWPGITFPQGVDPNQWTLKDLLTHQVPIQADMITCLEAYVTRVDPNDYPALIKKYATKREPGFNYDNLGYNIYGAILESATGKSWQDWLAETLFQPLGLKQTSARTSDFSFSELAWGHHWLGEDKGWLAIRPKQDSIMQAAGGMVTSPNDMAVWLQFQFSGAATKRTDLTPAILEKAHTIGVSVDPKAKNAYELPGIGYALGWNVCQLGDHILYIHGGGYTGCSTMMAFSPDLQVGIAAFSNSDNNTGWFTSRTIAMYFQYLMDDPKADQMAEVRQKVYPERVEKYLAAQKEQRATQIQEEQWAGWQWKPASEEMASFCGTFQGENRYLKLVVTPQAGHLNIQMDALNAELIPARKDLFAANTVPWESYEPILFQRDSEGRVISLSWAGDIYQKVGR